MDELKLTIPEAQELLLLSQSSVYSWIDKGKLQSAETPGGKVIVISRKEAEEIRNFNMKSRRNKVARQVLQKNIKDEFEAESPVINAEILENDGSESTQKASQDVTLQLISRIEELAVLRNEEKENVKFWQEKYHELNLELKKKDLEINALKVQIQELKGQKSILNFFKKH